MLDIAVCDDERQIAEAIAEFAERTCGELGREHRVTVYTDGKKLLEERKNFDLIFLDIEMPGINGIELAGLIREYDHNGQIVYVTNYRDYMRKAYRVHAFDYLSKPASYEDIFQIISDYIGLRDKAESRQIALVTINNENIMISESDMIYISCGHVKRSVIVITNRGDHICRGRINDIFALLDKKDFFMPHRSHIINLRMVKSFVKNSRVIMMNNDEIPLSRGNSLEFEKRLAENMLERVSVRSL